MNGEIPKDYSHGEGTLGELYAVVPVIHLRETIGQITGGARQPPLILYSLCEGFRLVQVGEKPKEGPQSLIWGDLVLPPMVTWGEFLVPNEYLERRPAVILVHGEDGVSMQEAQWAAMLHDMSVPTFILDSFTGRGFRRSFDTANTLSQEAMIVDVYRALALLSTHPRIDPKRIVLMGFSQGGTVAFYASLMRFRGLHGPDDGVARAARPSPWPALFVPCLRRIKLMRRIRVLLACLAAALCSVAVYQGFRGTVRNLDILGSYSITQEMSPAMLNYHLLPHLLEAIQAFKQTHGGQEPSHLLIRTSGVIDVE